MKKNKTGLIVGGVVILLAGWFFVFRKGEPEAEIEYRYSKATKGELMRSISATGVLVALTTVDVKSKAGGTVIQLAVDEGQVVKKGDLIAIIDPRDTRATYEQANADVQSSQARAEQARISSELQVASSKTSVEDAENALELAKVRLAKAQLEAERQPTLTKSSIQTAKAGYESASEELEKYQQVTEPQLRKEVMGNFERASAELDAAQSDYQRQQNFLKQGYVSQATVERAKSVLESARAGFNVANQRRENLEREIRAETRRLSLAKDRAEAALKEATVNGSQDQIALKNLEDSRKAVRTAEINLQRAKDATLNNRLRASEYVAAQAGTVRSRVQLDNAKVQLDSTTVLAPRDGVVTLKYLEEGTIIPPGTSTFSQGTSIVQISDVTRLFVECAVDEADISAVAIGQKVRIRTEAFPGMPLEGVVTRVNPSATTAQNITAIKVRIEVKPGFKAKILPGMNATCEFITMSKPDVLLVPGQAVTKEGDKSFVRVKGQDPKKPIKREVKVGESGNDGVEILSGLTEGEEVVTAEINIAELQAIQQKMIEAQQGGGLAGGGPRMGGGSRPGGGGGGGGRPGGGGR